MSRKLLRPFAVLLLAAMIGCATGNSHVTERHGMSDEDREVRKMAQVGLLGVSFLGLGAWTVESGYGYRKAATGTMIGTLVIDAVLGGIIVWVNWKDQIPCSNGPNYGGGPTYLPRCH